jgi:hypothetical protein
MATVALLETRDTTVLETVTRPPGVKAVEPKTNPDCELAVLVEPPIATTAGAVVAGLAGVPPALAAVDLKAENAIAKCK